MKTSQSPHLLENDYRCYSIEVFEIVKVYESEWNTNSWNFPTEPPFVKIL
ncbi:MAG: hypothetical protein Q8N03_10520 [Ignavibacteria bacterium]|jgi:hypothetical protein|nr:hypothetical protein [Ignavibacteria bacterium]MDP3831806.1 hypothetical protein [Ignavibacteriaceae bacterium]